MSMVGRVAIAAGILVLLADLGFAAVMFFTGDLTEISETFFTSAARGDMDTAYQLVSADFQANTNPEELAEFLTQNRFDDYASASWNSRSINGARGELAGSVTTRSGGTIPVAVKFVKGDDGWKIYSIEKPKVGLQTEGAPGDVAPSAAPPSPEEQLARAHETMSVFAGAVKARDMSAFHADVSEVWQAQWGVEEFEEALSGLYKLEGELAELLAGRTPVSDSAAGLDENGQVDLTGHHETTPRVDFVTGYFRENGRWN